LRLGEPHAALPLLHYVLLETSAHVRARALEAGVTVWWIVCTHLHMCCGA
jgi:hypothetical protein